MSARKIQHIKVLEELLNSGNDEISVLEQWLMGDLKEKIELLIVELVSRTKAYRHLEQRVKELEERIKQMERE